MRPFSFLPELKPNPTTMHNIISSVLIWILRFAFGALVSTVVVTLACLFLGDFSILVVLAVVAFSIIGYSRAE